MKKCNTCQEIKHHGEFYFTKSSGYYSSSCIDCEKKNNRERRKRTNTDGWINMFCGNEEFLTYYFWQNQ